ncbi:MAG TPA: cytochrome b/b6 domain-containing protein [Actinomycetota bacterium]
MGTRRLERHPRRVRWFHAAAYLATLPVLFTGWWLLAGEEGDPSPLARALGVADIRVHVWFGRALAVLALAAIVVGRRGIATFLRETFRRDRGDGRWWLLWPAAVFTGRFARHEGHFDPGQRLANFAMVGGLGMLVVTGLALTLLHGGPTFAWLAKIHRWTTYVVTAFVLGHVLVGLGVLPGYRGVWRAMHLRGRVPEETARRVWPGWTERALGESGPVPAACVDPAAGRATDGTGATLPAEPERRGARC